MLRFGRWKTAAILLVVLAGIVMTIPNFFSKETVDSWPDWLPKRQIVLGLDLQGGAYLLYEVDRTDYVDKRLRTLVSDIRKTLLTEPRIGYTGLGVAARASSSASAISTQLADARTRLETLRNPLVSSLFGGSSVNEFDLTVGDDGLVRFTYSQAGLDAARARHRRPVDRGHQPPHRRARHHRAEHPAPGRRPHPGRGARPRRSGAPEGDRRPDRPAHLPPRPADARRPARRREPKSGTMVVAVQRHPARRLRRRRHAADDRRGPGRRAGRLRPAHQRAGRQLPPVDRRARANSATSPRRTSAGRSPSCSTTR